MTVKSKQAKPLLVGYKYAQNMLAVWCPYCKVYHNHGWDHTLKASTAEHRCAHCHDSESPFQVGGYYIAVEPSRK